MSVVAVINYKGGVGKTTFTANVAGELAFRGRRVLLLDLDSQASLTFSFVRPDDWRKTLAPNKTIKQWFESHEQSQPTPLRDLILPWKGTSVKGKLDLIPSHLGLINVDLELASELGGATLKQNKRNYVSVHRRLATGLEELVPDYDVILIDCPPNFNIVTKTAIVASDKILVPAKPDYLSTLGIDYLKRNVDQLITDYNEYAELFEDGSVGPISPEIAGVVFTMVQFYAQEPISAHKQYIGQIRKLGLPVFEAMMRENKTLFSDAPEYGTPVVLTSYSNSTYRNIVHELEALAVEFQRRLM